jgi:tyrosyl-tRNA synthetase
MAKLNVYDELDRRGFIKQVTEPEPLKQLLEREPVVFYIGFDPTADSLHAGNLVTIMAMAHMQRLGHRPIAIIGSGTCMIGDPSGKTEMRKMMTRQHIVENGAKIRTQLERYLDFSQGWVVDNYEWLGALNYIDFLRDIGRHFSVNRMLSFETYKMRLETGLSFLEFNYQLLQAYDFLVLYQRYGCRLQMGGDDQWANILAGADLIRRLESVDAYGLTFPLLATASGVKMGKTVSGALWLDAARTSPYEYFQYWVNTDDRDVKRFLSFFTFLPMEEITAVEGLADRDLNAVKTILAYETTKITHGEEAARGALSSAMAAFGKREIPAQVVPTSTIPRGLLEIADDVIPGYRISRQEVESGRNLAEVLAAAGWVQSRGAARRLIQQGGVYVNNERVADENFPLAGQQVQDGKIIVRLGKKKYYNLVVE